MISSGLVSVTFRKLSPAQIVSLVQQSGLKGIEWGGDVHVPHGDLGRAREVRDLTQGAGVTVAAYGSYFRAAHSEEDGLPFQQVLDTALELGAPVIRVWAGPAGSADTDEDGRARVVADLRRIADEAAKVGVGIATEFHGGTLTDANVSACRLFADVNHPNLYSYWQPLIHLDEDACFTGLQQMAPWLSHLHVYQWNTVQDRRPLSEGTERWQKFLARADEIPGDRYAMLEFVADDSPENFLRDAATLRAWLKE